jgi:hypothetical protein
MAKPIHSLRLIHVDAGADVQCWDFDARDEADYNSGP